MIIKIQTHKRPNFSKLLSYVTQDRAKLKDSKGNSFVITHNLKGNTLAEWDKQYRYNETFRLRKRKDSVYINHEILSWHRDDAKHITPQVLHDLTREYISMRNPKGVYLAVPHFDKDHIHIHIVASGIEYRTGKSMRLSKQKLQKLKKDYQNYQLQRFPQLSKSTVNHEKKSGRISEREYQQKRRSDRATKKESIEVILKTCYKKADSKQRFYDLLKGFGIATYQRRGIVTGVVKDNMKFRFSRLGYPLEMMERLERKVKRQVEMQEKEINNMQQHIH